MIPCQDTIVIKCDMSHIFYNIATINILTEFLTKDMRFLITIILAAAAVVLRAPIETFDAAAISEMETNLRILQTSQNQDTFIDNEPSLQSSQEYDSAPLNISELPNRVMIGARQAIYHDTTSAARLGLLLTMNQVYSVWAAANDRPWVANPILRCVEIETMLVMDLTSVPVRYREDVISGWLLFFSSHSKI